MKRGVYRLRIFLDLRYPNIIDECYGAIRAIRTRDSSVTFVHQSSGCVEVSAYWKHWPCLFPQHGPGMKHTREISLRNWQEDIVSANPGELLRGLIHSDGWRGMNKVRGEGKKRYYWYPRYNFTSASEDIRRIFCNACDDYGVRWRRMNARTIAISRAADVAKLDLVVGPKT